MNDMIAAAIAAAQEKAAQFQPMPQLPLRPRTLADALASASSAVDHWLGVNEYGLYIDKDKKNGEKVEVNSSRYLGPKAAVQSKELLKQYLEWETHRRAQINNRLLYALFKSNVVGPADDSPAVEKASLQYLGFVPVSPDLAPFRYDWQKEEVVNLRHGSTRQPRLAKGIDNKSQLSQLLEEFASIRADLRFREDGIHTTVTMSRK